VFQKARDYVLMSANDSFHMISLAANGSATQRLKIHFLGST
jgi:hypothetical protein